jgi:Kef-type K+ transport system membrane component KefB
MAFCLLARRQENPRDMFVLLFGFMLANVGLSIALHLSLILTNMVFGMVIVNTQPHVLVQRIADELRNVMPLLFVLFFALAGASLHLGSLPALGLIGLVYILCRSTGLMGGAFLGAAMGRAERKIRRYLGLGILSQAGVAIGLALTVVNDLQGVGPLVAGEAGRAVTAGDRIGVMTITTITATCIFFELIGPVLTKIALERAGEAHAATGRAGR